MNDPYRSTTPVSDRPLIALRLPKVLEYTGLSRTQLYRLISTGRFPSPKKLSEGISAWNQRDIESWLEEKFLQPTKPKTERERKDVK